MDKYYYLNKYFGYKEFKKEQELIIDSVICKNDTIGLLPTGYGKSLTFQISALILGGLTIVITPLIALMEDQKASLVKKGIIAETINSNMTFLEINEIYNNLSNVNILYISPERVKNEFFIRRLNNIDVNLVVIDEAHTILWGETFRESFLKINSFINRINNKPVILALTATATNSTIEKVKYYLKLKKPRIIVGEMDRKNLVYSVVKKSDKINYILNFLCRNKENKGIIYCLTITKVEELSKILNKYGIRNTIYHSKLTNKEKISNQINFSKGIVNLMICTNAFGMGIDIPDIRFVIIYELCQTIEDMVQQLGRGGRDGKTSECIVLFNFQDIYKINYFIEQQRGIKDNRIINQYRNKLDELVDFCMTKKCRHRYINSYFGQNINDCYINCDNCKKKYGNLYKNILK